MSQTYGYVRVSTKEQNEARQLAAFDVAGIRRKTSIWTSAPVRILTGRSTAGCCAG